MRPDPRTLVPYVGDGMSGAVVEQILTSAERDGDERAARARASFEAWQEDADLPVVEGTPDGSKATCAWLETVGQREQIVAHYGHTADVLIIARPADETDYAAELEFETALVESGRPLLLVPPTGAPVFGARIIVGWNDSVEASRAVAAAFPLMRDASAVTIVSIDGGSEVEAKGEALKQYLAPHGIDAELVAVSEAGRNTGESLLAEVANANADMLVMGAYSHSRLRELVFGGVTRHVLREANVPVLLIH